MKLSKLKTTGKFLLCLVPIVLGVGFLFAWEFYIKENLNKEIVLVAKHDIGFKDKITKDDLEAVPKKIDDVVSGSYDETDIDKIVNGYASIKIRKGTQLYPELVDYYDIVPDESKGEFVAPLPNEWLFAVPGSLRRTYIADIYAVGTNDQKMLESLIEDSKTAGESEDGNAETSKTSDALVKNISKPILTNVRVSSVKDSSNNEVLEKSEVDSETANQSSGKISSLEIIATDESLSKIQAKTEMGYQLYVVYKFERAEGSTDEDNADEGNTEKSE